MTWPVLASLIAALAGLIAAIAQAARLVGDQAWYRRWREVLEHSTDESQRTVARERIDYYVTEFAVTDRTRKRRRAALGVGAFLLVMTLLLSGASVWWFTERITVVGWVLATVGLCAYVVALYLIMWFPDHERQRARRALADESAVTSISKSRRWWHLKRLRVLSLSAPR